MKSKKQKRMEAQKRQAEYTALSQQEKAERLSVFGSSKQKEKLAVRGWL